MKKDSYNRPLIFLTDEIAFPKVELADEEGLLAVGGDLSTERLILAYKSGIFPWFNEGSMILWWSPNPRMVLFPKRIKISKSMRKVIRNDEFKLTKNHCFEAVIDQCAKVKRQGQDGTWISKEMKEAYLDLHMLGYAHSYEVWQNEELVGGLYGIDLGHIFCGESMFSFVSNASKFAFIQLARELQEKNYTLIDCQLYTSHLESLGAEEIPRKKFMGFLKGTQ
ncbi:leucyl/phenylalanyl-tRNA--protein transferase [Maribacter sp. HTCC2170]|uniref:leucyl/phenylalanyl-tRNA--protein transferase n=1 Tax=Maribacter sp. (strain HTCC2170 / KCCM 42371) TaxID=313603 RepID=UPI0001E14DA5|nr:leucyl/phenylalanyl-tRNA--protein transferase [Maribacter sp. HTCC2170]EAQ99805.2 leucyl/phenylalanyl-tRNA--protein transferase [Maribacter sp. HTCC2170]